MSVHLDVPVSLSPGKQPELLFEHEDGKTPDLFWVLRKIGKKNKNVITVHPRTRHEGSEGD